ncbi:hypothetical protein A3D84_00565 [Candidatus Woesebacteria bacterium RIFCSPHIGHO2_02_FULL_42_20]|uniref:Uncharacterized protein n=1 Tax=Candidatus Woesebacteria bacterium RIFCSPHIGHO2_12_FULL_41_24 TaxID=1802510 RepID=A0A1F8ATV1_9BACT|nr:MAG: hypothetical protein A2W15_02070 [Candidatus Woesebacteria bacterium RBG_16_41_13]OGM29744.1 MAG: hypothetical protein A2873_02490 [Candidatus Woesebacteria bacterium RIFCSPHIGHO2_01_FULL_42_80]OGM35271.1 MAG: hypothetical protein A3D84_00565 [Candidatus Woesebacteria bacterium RIFCSPHIGHO2_02_FULL_42_20]OGM55166.1 MAG: hypothetical protein A3E44_04575 [Candidatus Woesebacteria bacterium RIFCSPHIGHO2_12_FULL_41_24]OGM67738.1 MAG: hypothetical protein A2969_02280 [Candidatus Woesebacteri
MPDIFINDPKSAHTPGPQQLVNQEQYPQVSLDMKLPNEKKHELYGHTHNPLAAYCYVPDHLNFETQDKKEKVVLLLRRHPITNLPWIIFVILMLFAPLLLIVFPVTAFLPARFQLISIMAWYVFVFTYAFENFLVWFFNVNIITDERIVDIDFHNFVYKEVTDAELDNIEDVTYTMGGPIRTMFNYGNVFVQTAGEAQNIEMLGIPKPDRVAKILQELRQEEEIERIEGRIR